MATITAKGRTEFGNASCVISGEMLVEDVSASKPVLEKMILDYIKNGYGHLGNDHPEPGTMLQGYATALSFFREEDIQIDGDIGHYESEPGVIY